MKVFIDSNIPMYVAGREHPNRAAALRILEQVRDGALEGCSSTEVLQEILYRYLGLKRPDLARKVYDHFVTLCPVILPVTIADTDRARDLACGEPRLSARDAVHAAVMLNHNLGHIATFDRGFDRIPGIKRVPL